jgi:hypothetical protein
MSQPPLPPYIYIRAGSAHDSALFLMDSLLFTVPGSLPDGCILPHIVCGGGGIKQGGARLGEHDGLPVFGVDIPAAVFAEMIHGIRFMDLLPDMYRHVPPKLHKAGMSLYTWRRYLMHYGLALEDDGSGEEEDSAAKIARDRAAKRARLEEDPRGQLLKRIVIALATRIKEEHPQWAQFVAGTHAKLHCVFVSTYKANVQGDRTFYLTVPGEPVVQERICVAWALGLGLNSNGTGRALSPGGLQCREEAIEDWLLAELCGAENFSAHLYNLRTRNSKAKKPDLIKEWPTSLDGREVSLTPGAHDILGLKIYPKTDV